MLVTIHQPEHLPWLGFFDKMQQADVFVLLDNTQFAKEDFQNRNRIKTRTGVAWVTVPVFKKGASEQRITEVEICNDQRWRPRCWGLISQNYSRAPHFNTYQSFFKDLYSQPWPYLAELNLAIIKYLAAALGLTARLVKASELGISERGASHTNLAICRALNASVYLSGRFGKQYLDEAQFREYGIEVRYQDFHYPRYPQLWGQFEPNLSAIDLLFNCGEASGEIIAQANSAEALSLASN